MPPSLSFFALKQSLSNKLDHTRNENGNDQQLIHANYRLIHSKNYSWDVGLEMFFNTSVNNLRMVCEGYVITKEIKVDKALFVHEPNI